MPNLTDKYVDNLAVEAGKKILTAYDTELKGFAIAVMPSGTKTYFYGYVTQEGVQRKYKIGRHGVLAAAEARKRAKEIAKDVFYGKDPGGNKKARKQEALLKKASTKTIKELCEYYVSIYSKHDKRLSTIQEDWYRINSYILPSFGHKSLEEITLSWLEEWRLTMKERPVQANRVLALLSSMYSKAIKWGWCEKNPVKGISKYPEEKRERYLDEEELCRLMEVLASHKGYPAADALHLIVLTGSRRGEVLNATWGQFNFDKGVWTKPSHMTKQKKTEHLPLSGEALEFCARPLRAGNGGARRGFA